MSGRDWQAFDAELRGRAPEIAAELLGKPTSRTGQEWRWGRKGSLAVVVAGARAGMWFDHEAGTGGGLVDLVARTRGLSRPEALDWTADRIGVAATSGGWRRPANRAKRPAADIPTRRPARTPEPEHEEPDKTGDRTGGTPPAAAAAIRAARTLGSGARRPRPIIPISGASRSGRTGCAATAPAT